MQFEFISQLTDAQIGDLLDLYHQVWWAKERAERDVRLMLKHTPIVVALCETEGSRLVGFARVITDFVYKALILDVIVAETHRGLGLGDHLMNAIVEHPDLQNVRHFELYCKPEMIPFYEKWNFSTDLKDVILMRLTTVSTQTRRT